MSNEQEQVKAQDRRSELSALLGEQVTTHRGFPMVNFKDAYGAECRVQCSSAIGDYADGFERPGTSFLWVGVDDPDPQVMAVDAAKHGIKTKETTGWVPFPIPGDVSINTRMHLNREQVQGLIARLQEWLETGSFT